MSGPVGTEDSPAVADAGHPEPSCVEVTESHEAAVGRFTVRRALPRRARRTVGAWCFADHMGPADVTEGSGLDVGPHPHAGLATVTWLLDGQVLHRDSLGSEQVIAPGQLNLMAAGHGVAHSEEATGRYAGPLEGIQLWIAQPGSTRHGAAAFEHHAELPRVAGERGVATVLVGELAGAASPARHDTPLVGADLALAGGRGAWPLRGGWEYALVVLRGAVDVDGWDVGPGRLAYLGRGRPELVLDAAPDTRAVLLGGEPFGEPVLMWWNFVARTRDELDEAYLAWQREGVRPGAPGHAGGAARFGEVASPLARIAAPVPFWWRRGDGPG